MKRTAFVAIASVAFLLTAAAPAADWKERTLAAAGPFIDTANAEWSRAIVTGNADVLSAPYAANAVFIGPAGTAIQSKAGVRTMYARRPAGVNVLKASIHSDGRAAADPDDVYEWGTATVSVKHGKSIRQTNARYLTVWHRSGKRWLITRNIAF